MTVAEPNTDVYLNVHHEQPTLTLTSLEVMDLCERFSKLGAVTGLVVWNEDYQAGILVCHKDDVADISVGLRSGKFVVSANTSGTAAQFELASHAPADGS